MGETRTFKRVSLSQSEVELLCARRGEEYHESSGRVRKRLTKSEWAVILNFRKAIFDKREAEKSKESEKEAVGEIKELKKENQSLKSQIDSLQPLFEFQNQRGKIDFIQIKPQRSNKGKRETVPIVSLSDWHYEEVVRGESVMGLNEYNISIARQRAINCFTAIKKLIQHQQTNFNISQVVVALLGDFIGGWIHDELMQTNEKSPMAAIKECKSVIVSGLKMLHDELDVEKITIVGVVGNHGRTSKKNQFSNITDVNYEYFMYQDIKEACELAGLNKFEWIIPKAEMVRVRLLEKNLLFMHGHNIKYGGGIGGLSVPLNRWIAQFSKSIPVDMVFMGHFHQLMFLNKTIVNGSLKGFDAYAISKGLEFERAKQNMVLLDSEFGFCAMIPIYCD